MPLEFFTTNMQMRANIKVYIPYKLILISYPKYKIFGRNPGEPPAL
jgi:hypothetical protein